MKIKANEFSNKEITVTYDAFKCSLSGVCIKQLANVFRDSVIPWVDIDGESTEKIIEQIKKCPSGALDYYKISNKKAS